MKISIVTVVKNGRDVVTRAIESVLSQDHPEIEYVVVDGGSSDGTVELLRAYGGRIDRFLSEPDEGIADAFNKGIALTSGEVIGLLNADDEYLPGTVSRVAAALESRPEVDVVCGGLDFYRGREKLWSAFSDPGGLERNMSVQHPSTFVRRRRYERSGVFRTDFVCAMDYELLLRFKMDGAVFLALPEPLAAMQVGGLSHRRWHLASLEVARAQRMAGLGAVRAALGHGRRLVDRPLRRFLDRLGWPGGWRDLARAARRPR